MNERFARYPSLAGKVVFVTGGGSGIGVWSRPDAHTIQYRLYCKAKRPVFEAQAPVFTDGVLHEFEVPADEDASRQ